MSHRPPAVVDAEAVKVTGTFEDSAKDWGVVIPPVEYTNESDKGEAARLAPPVTVSVTGTPKIPAEVETVMLPE